MAKFPWCAGQGRTQGGQDPRGSAGPKKVRAEKENGSLKEKARRQRSVFRSQRRTRNGCMRLDPRFGFDPKRKAILLMAGDKSGVGEKRFYRELIRKADNRFDDHLARLKRGRR